MQVSPSFGDMERQVLDLFDKAVLCLSDMQVRQRRSPGGFAAPPPRPLNAAALTLRPPALPRRRPVAARGVQAHSTTVS